ncbi:hypothetical protein EFL77_04140 [Pediococcus pentosaceus]|uniref:hypothetical protein n=1 Tax=Pediococcus pentosaceus TaxID=1255 RepID=UPI00223B632F|nr:hypothetical protein [Pediococcus pentosaceus]MCT1177708.1 hypothetical protein [Pediococcus pentosaceus]
MSIKKTKHWFIKKTSIALATITFLSPIFAPLVSADNTSYNINVDKTALQKEVDRSKSLKVHLTHDQDKTLVGNVSDRAKLQKQASDENSNTLSALKKVDDAQAVDNTDFKNKMDDYNKQWTTYNQKEKEYQSKLNAWEEYMKHPDYEGQVAWSKPDLDKLFDGRAGTMNYVRVNKNSKFSVVKGKVLSQSELNSVKNYSSVGANIVKNYDHKTLFKAEKGLSFKYARAFQDTVSKKWIDIKVTATNFATNPNKKAPVNIIRPGRSYIGMDEFQPITYVDWQVDYLVSGTNTPQKINSIYSFGDLDALQYLKIQQPSSYNVVYGNKVAKNGNSYNAGSASTASDDPQAQVWFIANSLSQIKFRWGTKKTSNPYNSDAWETGTLPFLIKEKTKPKEPAKPTIKKPVQKVENGNYHFVNLVLHPKNQKDVKMGSTNSLDAPSINGKVVPFGMNVSFPLKNDALPAGRVDKTTSYSMIDTLPDGLVYQTNETNKLLAKDLWNIKVTGQKVEINATSKLLDQMNNDLSKDFTVPTPVIVAKTNKNHATLVNSYDTKINNNYTTHSNEVKITTTNKITPPRTGSNNLLFYIFSTIVVLMIGTVVVIKKHSLK